MLQGLPTGTIQDYGGTGAPVVMVGDILGGHASWSRHAERLTPQWRALTVTPLVVARAAQGEPAPEGWDIGMESRALAAALDGLGVSTAHVVGWSLGGTIALDFALAHPERVLTLALVEPQVRWVLRRLGRHVQEEKADSERFRVFVDMPITEEVLAAFLRLVGVVAPDEDPTESRAWPLAWTHRLALASAYRVIAHDDDPARLGRLRMPVLLVHGEDASAMDRAMTTTLGELLPQAAVMLLLGGHTSHMTAMDRFMEALEGLLAGGEP